MTNIAEFDLRAAERTGTEHLHPRQLIMHWMDKCTDPEVHRIAAASNLVANPITHRDQLVAVWMEQAAALPRTVA